MVVELIGHKRRMSYTHAEWRKVVHLALRYGWKPAGAEPSRQEPAADPQARASPEKPARAKRPHGFDEATWAFRLDSAHGIPRDHPLAYCSEVLLYCEDPALGSYFDHARVNDADARALADALEKA